MRLSTMILPIYPWAEGREVWRRAESLGFHGAYTYDHLTWRTFREDTWFGAIPTLTAAAGITERIRLGTLVTSPNFRHPVPLAKELVTLADISGDRLTVGVGAGGSGFDATALGQTAWSPKERADRLEEFLPLLAQIVREPLVTSHGKYYSAQDVRMVPTKPTLPICVAATGPRGMRLTAQYGQGWLTFGDPQHPDIPAEDCPKVIAAQLTRLADTCAAQGRDVDSLSKMLVHGSTAERPLDSLDAFVDYAGRYQELGIDEIVLHWPVPGSVYDADPAIFELIAVEGLTQLGQRPK